MVNGRHESDQICLFIYRLMKFRKTFFRLWPKICKLLKNERPRFFSIEINIIWFYDTWFWIVSLKTILWYLNWFELRWMAGMYADKNASKRRVMCIKQVCFPSVWIEPSKISWQQCKRKSIHRKGPGCPQKWSLHTFSFPQWQSASSFKVQITKCKGASMTTY